MAIAASGPRACGAFSGGAREGPPESGGLRPAPRQRPESRPFLLGSRRPRLALPAACACPESLLRSRQLISGPVGAPKQRGEGAGGADGEAEGGARLLSPETWPAGPSASPAASGRPEGCVAWLPGQAGLCRQEKMAQSHVGINRDDGDWEWRADSSERARLLQSPGAEEPRPASTSTSTSTSMLGAVFIVVNAALGAGLLNFPAAFRMAGGVAAGIAMQMGLLLFIIGGLVILAYCSQASNERTYQEVVWAVCGRVLGVLCEVAIVIYTFGTCIAFLIIIGDQQDKIIPVLMKSCAKNCWFTDRKCTISITAILFILPLSIPKEIGFQKYASCLSVIGTWYVTIVVIIKYFWPDQVISPEEITTSPASWVSVFNAMPTICFGFQCHVSSVPIFNSMKSPQVRSWGVVVTAAMVIALFVYMGTGVCGFLTFGESVQQDVLLSYPSDDIPVAIARAFIILSVLTSYPILHFCGRAVVEGLWLRYKGETVDEDVAQERRRRLLQTFCWFLLTLLLALFIPDIGRVISVIGGLAACFIFVFPGLCLIHTKLSEVQGAGGVSWWMVVSYGIFMVVLGTFIFGQTTANAISMDLRK